MNREDEHANALSRHGQRLNQHDHDIASINAVLIGDNEKRYTGLLDRIAKLEEVVLEIKQWRRDLRIAIKVGLGLLSIVGAGVWWPILRTILGSF